jgi:hypothetical protein
MSQPAFDLSDLFGVALQTMIAHRQEINALDGYNGNHGDNMVENLRMTTEALRARRSQPPAEALRYASQTLQERGRGGTSQYYARGLGQAADQLQGRSAVGSDDILSLVQSLLGAIPSQGSQRDLQANGSVLEQVMGLVGGQPRQARPQGDSFGLDDVVSALLPAGLAFLQAQQSGADMTSAAQQAVIAALMGGQVNPLQAGTPRAAAGSLIAQSMLQALAGRR